MARLLVCRGASGAALATPAARGRGTGAGVKRPSHRLFVKSGPSGLRRIKRRRVQRQAGGVCAPGSRRPAAGPPAGPAWRDRRWFPVPGRRIRRRPADRVPAAGGAASAPPARRFPAAAPRDRPRRMAASRKGKWVQPSTSTSAPASRAARAPGLLRRRAGRGLPARRARPGRPTRGRAAAGCAPPGASRCTRAANLRLASVPVVANTPITPLAVRWAAGLMAGSTPITIRPGWRARRSAMAAAVAVLQATTMAWRRARRSSPRWFSARRRT